MFNEEPRKAAVIYARYSSHNQREVSIDQQVKEVTQYADREGLQIVGLYADKAITGTSDKRPEFQRMIADAAKGAFDYVIVYTLDRFARDRYDSAVYKRELKTHGVKVLSAMENISDDPSGVLMESLLEGLAEYYSKELSRKIRRGNLDNAERCLANGSLPLGYVRGEDGRYALCEAEAAIVKEIFQRIANGEGTAAIARDLNVRGVKTKTGKSWTVSSFGKLLSNERYTGIYIYGDVRIEGGVPAILDKELYNKVQTILLNKKNPRKGPKSRRRDNSVYLLTGKLYCGHCKAPMLGVSGTGRNGELHHYYTCNTRRTTHECKKKNVRREWIEQKIAEVLKMYVLQDDVIEWMAGKTMDYLLGQETTLQLESLRMRLAESIKARDNVMTAIEQGIITATTKARLTQLENDVAELQSQIDYEKAKNKVTVSREDIVAFLKSFQSGDIEDKRFQETLIDTYLVSVYLYDDKLKLICGYTGGKELDIPLDIDTFVPESPSDICDLVRIESTQVHQSTLIRTTTLFVVSGLFVLTHELT